MSDTAVVMDCGGMQQDGPSEGGDYLGSMTWVSLVELIKRLVGEGSPPVVEVTNRLTGGKSFGRVTGARIHEPRPVFVLESSHQFKKDGDTWRDAGCTEDRILFHRINLPERLPEGMASFKTMDLIYVLHPYGTKSFPPST